MRTKLARTGSLSSCSSRARRILCRLVLWEEGRGGNERVQTGVTGMTGRIWRDGNKGTENGSFGSNLVRGKTSGEPADQDLGRRLS